MFGATSTTIWHDFHAVLQDAAMYVADMGLADDHRILQRIIFRGTSLFRRFNCPVIALAFFADKLPNARGVAKAQLERNGKGARAL